MTNAVSDLATLVRERQPCIVLTGAGISTESGIPDFRSPSGIWAKYDPMEYATIAAFRRNPVKVWQFYALRFELLTSAEPNEGHLALAELERRGLVEAVVTQNVDGLHRRAGSQGSWKCTGRSGRPAAWSAASVSRSTTWSPR